MRDEVRHANRWAFGFLFLGMAIAVILLAASLHRLDKNDDKFVALAKASCVDRTKQYETTLVLIDIQTAHIDVPPTLAGIESEVERYRIANERRDRNRVQLLEQLGERPNCADIRA